MFVLAQCDQQSSARTPDLHDCTALRVTQPCRISGAKVRVHQQPAANQVLMIATGAGNPWLAKSLHCCRRQSPQRERMEPLNIEGSEAAERDLAKLHGFMEHRVEDRREVAGRAVDDLQDLGRGGLLSQRLVALSAASGKLAPEARNLCFLPCRSGTATADDLRIGAL